MILLETGWRADCVIYTNWINLFAPLRPEKNRSKLIYLGINCAFNLVKIAKLYIPHFWEHTLWFHQHLQVSTTLTFKNNC